MKWQCRITNKYRPRDDSYQTVSLGGYYGLAGYELWVKKMTKFAALFVRKDSSYKKRDVFDTWDIDRDALKFDGNEPVVCHPPCRAWGRLSHMATRVREGEPELALWSIDLIRSNGGILEHPKGSRLFGKYLPNVGEIDEFGGFTILIDQYDFGHVAHKKTNLYFCGLTPEQLPDLPPEDTTIHYCEKGKRRSIAGNVKGTTNCTQYQREYTPDKLIDYFEKVLAIILDNKRMLLDD
jgi:hypothetical protein